MKPNQHTGFSPINSGYNRVFKRGKLSVGLVVPIENYDNASIPSMQRHIERVQLAEELGFQLFGYETSPLMSPLLAMPVNFMTLSFILVHLPYKPVR
jgi:hypothetical protein